MSAGPGQTEDTSQSAARWRSWPLVAKMAAWPGWERYGPAARSWSGAVVVNAGIAILFILGFGPVRPPPPPIVEPVPVQLFVELPELPEPEPPEPEPPKPEPAPPPPAPPPTDPPEPDPPPPEPIPPPPAPDPEPEPDLPPFVPLDAQPIEAPDVLGEAVPDIPLQAEVTPQPLSDLPTFEAEPAPFYEAASIPVPGPEAPADVPLSSEPLQQDLPQFQAEPTPDPEPPAPDAPDLPDEEDEEEGESVAAAPAPAPAATTFGPPPSGIDLGPPAGAARGLRGLLGEDECRSREERLRGDCPPAFAGIQRPGDDLLGPDLTEGIRTYGEVVGVDESMRRARALDMTRDRPLPNGGVEGLGGINDLTGRLPPEHPDPGKAQ